MLSPITIFDPLISQAYADRGDYEGALAAMEEAVHSMPRTKHRLHIFKHRILTKAKLGMDVTMDIQRFKEEPEEVHFGRIGITRPHLHIAVQSSLPVIKDVSR